MFTIDSSITDLKVKDRNLFKVFFSMNNHQVANPEMSLEEARSYVFFFKDGGRYQAYVGLYFIPSDRRMFYSYSSPSFGENEMADVEEEARSFAEGLGAMLDEIHFSGLSTEDRNNWIDAQEMLSRKKKEPEAAAAAAAPIPVPEPAAVQPPPVEPATPAPVPQPVPQSAAAPAQSSPASSGPAPTAPEPVARAVPRAWQPPQQQAAQPPVVEQIPVPVDAPAPASLKTPRKQAAPVLEEAAGHEEDQNESTSGVDNVLDEAVRAGVVKAPKVRLKKDIRTSAGPLGREKEALARLLSSF